MQVPFLSFRAIKNYLCNITTLGFATLSKEMSAVLVNSS